MRMIDLNPTPADREQLQRDGYLLVRGLVNAPGVERLLQWTTELETGPEITGRHWLYREDSLTSPRRKIVQRIENFCPFHVGFDGFVRHGALAEWTSVLMGGPVVLFKDKINFKMAGGAGFKLHQDQQAGWSTYAPLFVTALVSLDAATAESGCLEIAAGRHREGLIGSEWKPMHETGIDLTSVPTAPGDAIFFDSYVPHASQANFTDRPRRILYLTYNLATAGDHRTRYYADKYASFPPDIDRDPARTYTFRV
jgi:2-aminoethylphosphonate dioxygenase